MYQKSDRIGKYGPVFKNRSVLGQCGDPWEDVSVIADQNFEKLGSIADQGPQARGLQ